MVAPRPCRPRARLPPWKFHSAPPAVGLRSSSGRLAMLAAMRLASSRVSRFAAARPPGSFSKVDVSERFPVGDPFTMKASGVRLVDRPWRPEAALRHHGNLASTLGAGRSGKFGGTATTEAQPENVNRPQYPATAIAPRSAVRQ